ncbi:MAG: VWA domain-containing protein [gamma proteobacterium symbiont of Taylorina sp.]|nr:VWA domain-containing protein [gamma proteobacterium symbiont of Taylorina sp.]
MKTQLLHQPIHYKLLSFLFIVILLSLLQTKVLANTTEIKLSTNMATTVMEADKHQTAFLKVSLTGFDIDEQQTRIPANIAIVLDKSGSMRGQKINYARQAAIHAIRQLNNNDIVSVVTYDSQVNVIVPSTKVSDKTTINRLIRSIQADGNTALFAGVSKGAAELRKFISKNKVNRVILLSDGLANVGPKSPSELGQLGMSLSREGISVTTIGLGLGYNEDLMTQLAGFSDGNHAFVEKPSDLVKIFQYEFGDVLSVIAQDVNIIIECGENIRPIRILGRKGDIIGNKVSTRMNQLYSGQEKFIMIEVEVPEHHENTNAVIATVEIDYNNLYTHSRYNLKDSVSVNFSASKKAVKESINPQVYESSVEQVANEYSKQALQLRDEGDISGARKMLNKVADYLQSNAGMLSSKRLRGQEMEARKDADEVDDSSNWQKKRKVLKETQYKRSVQQSY